MSASSSIVELHHVKAVNLVRETASLLELAELEFTEREGNSRPSVLEAMEARASELAEALEEEERGDAVAAITDGVGDGAKLVLEALQPSEQAEPEPGPVREPMPAREPTPAPKRASAPKSSPRPEERARARRDEGRALVGPQVRVRDEASGRDTLVATSKLRRRE